MLEVYHVGYAVRDLEAALKDFQGVLGGRTTDPEPFDVLMHMPLDHSEPLRVRGRSAWLVGPPTPFEFWEGELESPWYIEDPHDQTAHMHHCCVWSDDPSATVEKFRGIGFEPEMTPVHDGEGILGFCYVRNPSGTRIEIQSSADKPSVMNWMNKGTPKVLEWMKYVK